MKVEVFYEPRKWRYIFFPAESEFQVPSSLEPIGTHDSSLFPGVSEERLQRAFAEDGYFWYGPLI
jgi:hypothetical protein